MTAPVPQHVPEATLRDRTAELHALREEVRQGPCRKATETQHTKGKLTVRERVDLLLDEGSSPRWSRCADTAPPDSAWRPSVPTPME